jgi:hypothetical protein
MDVDVPDAQDDPQESEVFLDGHTNEQDRQEGSSSSQSK